jgi:hypothetical protein
MNKWLVTILILIFGVIPIGIVSYILAYNLISVLHNLGNSNYVDILFSGFAAFGTIILATATFISLFITQIKDDKKKKEILNQLNIAHLADIKENCLKPMLGLINDYYNNYCMFEISEESKFNDVLLQNELDYPTHFWDKKLVYGGINYNAIVNNKLYNDLEYHKITKGIVHEFHNFLELIISNCMQYKESLKELFIKIKNYEEFKQLVLRIEQKDKAKNTILLNDTKYDYIRLIIIISLGYSDIEYVYQNYFKMAYDIGEYENIKNIGNFYKESNEVKKILLLKNEVKSNYEPLRKKIIHILNYEDLLDECDYLKIKRKIIFAE